MKAILILFFFFTSCSEEPSTPNGEYIFRQHADKQFSLENPLPAERKPYPWEEGKVGRFPKISKEFFRCKGSSLNPPLTLDNQTLLDCNGPDRHSLPLIDGKENVYPILVDLLNYLQQETKKRVIITSGHRCPDHNTYVDSSPGNQTSKHTIGAEVSFYVQGYEEKPQTIINLLKAYYKNHPDKKFSEFKPYEKTDTGVSTPPTYNHEIFIKLYKKKEGRNHDNRHPYPYLSLQVRTDKNNERVIYSWDKAYNNFLRY